MIFASKTTSRTMRSLLPENHYFCNKKAKYGNDYPKRGAEFSAKILVYLEDYCYLYAVKTETVSRCNVSKNRPKSLNIYT